MDQYAFVVREVERLTKPGRLSCVHCTDLKRGMWYQHDFPGDVIKVHEAAGMHYFARVAIWKDAWDFARRTRMRSLMHKTIVNDSSCSRSAPADYLIVFKKRGDNPEPITHANGFSDYAGSTPIPPELIRECAGYTGDQRKNVMSHWIYRQYASPVWMDIRRGRMLSRDDARESDEERHVCPLQLDVIDRCLSLWSNPGDTVLSPFMGIGSEIHQAVAMRRQGIGMELKGTYYRQAKANVAAALESSFRKEFPVPVAPPPRQQYIIPADEDGMLECGHPATAENWSANYGCVVCDCGGKPKKKRKKNEEAV